MLFSVFFFVNKGIAKPFPITEIILTVKFEKDRKIIPGWGYDIMNNSIIIEKL